MVEEHESEAKLKSALNCQLNVKTKVISLSQPRDSNYFLLVVETKGGYYYKTGKVV